MSEKITHQRLRDLLTYEPETGLFRARQKLGTRRNVGDVAGSLGHKNGYASIRLDGRGYYLHILAWFYVTGEWPTETIDHIDRVRHNNSWANLRHVSMTVQNQNTGKRRGGRSHFVGVSQWKDTGKWYAQIKGPKQRHYLGTFEREEDAATAYARAKRVLHQDHLVGKAA